MSSYRISVSPKRKVAAKFVVQVRRRLQKALAEKQGISRADIARSLEVHRSVVTKHFNGSQDMTLGRAAEMAWALGFEPEFVLHSTVPDKSCNADTSWPAKVKVATSTNSSIRKVNVCELEVQ